MKKTIFTIILLVLFSSILPAAKSETLRENNKPELIQFLKSKMEKANSGDRRLKKKKLRKAVRKGGRLYRDVRSDRESKKKSRKVQRSVRKFINIF